MDQIGPCFNLGNLPVLGSGHPYKTSAAWGTSPWRRRGDGRPRHPGTHARHPRWTSKNLRAAAADSASPARAHACSSGPTRARSPAWGAVARNKVSPSAGAPRQRTRGRRRAAPTSMTPVRAPTVPLVAGRSARVPSAVPSQRTQTRRLARGGRLPDGVLLAQEGFAAKKAGGLMVLLGLDLKSSGEAQAGPGGSPCSKERVRQAQGDAHLGRQRPGTRASLDPPRHRQAVPVRAGPRATRPGHPEVVPEWLPGMPRLTSPHCQEPTQATPA